MVAPVSSLIRLSLMSSLRFSSLPGARCLEKFYGEPAPPKLQPGQVNMWACPGCRGLCTCAACKRGETRQETIEAALLMHHSRIMPNQQQPQPSAASIRSAKSIAAVSTNSKASVKQSSPSRIRSGASQKKQRQQPVPYQGATKQNLISRKRKSTGSDVTQFKSKSKSISSLSFPSTPFTSRVQLSHRSSRHASRELHSSNTSTNTSMEREEEETEETTSLVQEAPLDIEESDAHMLELAKRGRRASHDLVDLHGHDLSMLDFDHSAASSLGSHLRVWSPAPPSTVVSPAHTYASLGLPSPSNAFQQLLSLPTSPMGFRRSPRHATAMNAQRRHSLGLSALGIEPLPEFL